MEIVDVTIAIKSYSLSINIRLVPYILDSKESNITSPWASFEGVNSRPLRL